MRRSTRARACSACRIPAAPGSTPSRARATPAAYDFPVARVPGLDFSFSGLKTSLLYAVRDLAPSELEARRADLAASYQRAIVRALVERIEAAGTERVAIVGGVAANSELRAALPESRRRSARSLYRQRSDDRFRRALHPGPSRPPSTLRSMRMRRRSELILLLVLGAIGAAAWLTVRGSQTADAAAPAPGRLVAGPRRCRPP